MFTLFFNNNIIYIIYRAIKWLDCESSSSDEEERRIIDKRLQKIFDYEPSEDGIIAGTSSQDPGKLIKIN